MAPQERFQSRLRLSRRDFQYFGILALAIALVFWDILFLQKAFLSGDHLIQHYPWAKFLQDSIRHFRLPWWTSEIQSGFPLLAEGQIGAFYPPNLIFLFLLPLRWAYNDEILFHFALGGLFFYLYLRQLKLSSEAAFFSTLIFLFGSCEGGFFYNITSQRVSVWFPLALLLIERLIERRNLRDASWLGIVFAFQIFAGYLQVAIYCMAFTTLYFFLRAAPWFAENRVFNRQLIFLYAVALGIGLGISAIQWVPSIRLSAYSARAEAGEALAYMGSTLPFFGMSVLFPAWTGFWKGGIYIGVLGLFFALGSLVSQKRGIEKLWIFIILVSILLGLGKYSPLYVLIVKLFHLYFFRIPSKFLFFASFGLSLLAGFGFEKFLEVRRENHAFKRSLILLLSFFFLIVGAIAVSHAVARSYQEPILHLLEGYVQKSIYGRAYHPHSLETYQERLHYYYEYFLYVTTPKAKETGWPIAVFFVQITACCWLREKKKRVATVGLVFLLFADLYGYAQINTRTDLEPYSKIEIKSPLAEILRQDHDLFRVHEFNTDPLHLDAFPFVPNRNMMLGLQDTGIYSPFAFAEYKRFLGNLGGVDDSLFQNPATLEALEKNREILNRLNVKYILSNVPLKAKGLEKIAEDKVMLYQNKEAWPRAFWVESLTGPSVFRNLQKVNMVQQDKGRLIFRTEGLRKGYIVVSEQNYPGWTAFERDQKIELIPLGTCLKAIPISGEGNEAKLIYQEKYKKPLSLLSLLSGLSALFILIARPAGKY